MSSLSEKEIFTVVREGAAPLFVETGTFRGDTAAWALDHFRQVYSIELSRELHEKCRERFAREDRVTLLQGDSAAVLGELLPKIDGRCFFWLDAHFSSGETACGEVSVPLIEELEIIAGHRRKDHIIVIDDCRLFGWKSDDGREDWQSVTRDRVENALRRINPGIRIFEYHDTIVAAPKSCLHALRRIRLIPGKIRRILGGLRPSP